MASRRGFLGMLAASPVIGPQVAQSAMNTSPPVAPSIDEQWAQARIDSENLFGYAKRDYKQSIVSALREEERSLDHQMLGADDGLHIGQNGLDPDLQTNKSFSLAAKHRIQIERYHAKRREYYTRRAQTRIDFLKSALNGEIDMATAVSMYENGMRHHDYMPRVDKLLAYAKKWFNNDQGK